MKTEILVIDDGSSDDSSFLLSDGSASNMELSNSDDGDLVLSDVTQANLSQSSAVNDNRAVSCVDDLAATLL